RGAVVAYVLRKDFVNVLDKFYMLQLPIAAKLKRLLPPLIRTIDFALEWCNIASGALLASQGDRANGFHIVISGRFRVVRHNRLENSDDEQANGNLIDRSNSAPDEHKTKEWEVLGEYGHGQSIGEVEVLTAARRSSSLIAVRDSETARIPRTLFEMLLLLNPAIMVKLSRIVAQRVLESKNRDVLVGSVSAPTSLRASEFNADYKTITILPT
ncbi:camp-binding domain-like protein, partial [Metschnikowia bicuspidata]